MNLSQIGSIKEGTILVGVSMQGPWPLSTPLTMAELKLTDGIAYLICDPSGSLRVKIHDSEDRPVLDVLTCPIDIPQQMSAKIAFAWSLPDDWSLFINGKRAGSSNPSEIPERLLLEKRPPPQKREDFSRQNNLAVRRRHDRLAGWQPIPGRVKSTNLEIRAALEDEILQIQDLLGHLREGKLHHVKGLCRSLRMLIATGKPMPILQLYAATRDKPLIVYFDQVDNLTNFVREGGVVSFNVMPIQPEPVEDYPVPIDLNVWLENPWGAITGQILTNRQALKSIGDTIASHFDQDVLPLVVTLRTIKTEMHGIGIDFLLLYLGNVAVTVLKLGQSLLRDE